MATRKDDPLYVISVAARMIGVHAQTLRYYERAGLIEPSRSEGNHRYYSERDLERLRLIKMMMDDMGMNLAGAEVVLKLTEKVREQEYQIKQLILENRRLISEQEMPALKDGDLSKR